MRRFLSSTGCGIPTMPTSPRGLATLESELLSQLRALPHPTLQPLRTLGELSMVRTLTITPPAPGAPGTTSSTSTSPSQVDSGGFTVTVDIDPIFPGSPSFAPLAASITASTRGSIPPTTHIRVREVVSARGGSPAFTPLGGGLTHLRTAIAVASGKGGVGKSTVAVNLAFALALQGGRVGVLDADVQGPSLPTMVTPPRLEVGKVPGGGECINALESPPLPPSAPPGTPPLALASYGWVSPRNPATGARTGAALMRGPLLATTIRQLAKFTAWGGRDALVVDTPPGTGDVHLTLGQLVPFTGAVVVTTPQAVACADTDKGLQMLGSLAVPVLAMVLNQAHFVGDGGRVYYPFGQGGGARVAALAARYGIPPTRIYHLPMEEGVSQACDSGTPLVVSHPDSLAAAVFRGMARDLAGDLEGKLAGGGGGSSSSSSSSAGAVAEGNAAQGTTTSVSWDKGKRVVVVKWHGVEGGGVAYLEPRALRLACRCAGCVDELSGVVRVREGSVPGDVAPVRVEAKGNYGVAIAWSDGHESSIYTYAQLMARKA